MDGVCALSMEGKRSIMHTIHLHAAFCCAPHRMVSRHVTAVISSQERIWPRKHGRRAATHVMASGQGSMHAEANVQHASALSACKRQLAVTCGCVDGAARALGLGLGLGLLMVCLCCRGRQRGQHLSSMSTGSSRSAGCTGSTLDGPSRWPSGLQLARVRCCRPNLLSQQYSGTCSVCSVGLGGFCLLRAGGLDRLNLNGHAAMTASEHSGQQLRAFIQAHSPGSVRLCRVVYPCWPPWLCPHLFK